MLPRTYDSQECPVAGALECVGERWTLLIVRDAFRGTRRFEDFQRGLGIARNVLTARLGRLVEDGVLERRLYQEHPPRWEYRLTEKGFELWPVVVALMRWGGRHAACADVEPVALRHRGCGGEVDERLRCEECGAVVGPREAEAPTAAPAPAAA